MWNFLTLEDYEQAKAEASKRIVRRQSRGNVSAQDGWYMTAEKLADVSRQADKAIASLRKAIKR